MSQKFFEKGLHFKCQGSGKCCVSRGEYGFVYMTKLDQKRMAKALGMGLRRFRQQYIGATDGVEHLVQPDHTEDCVFLKEARCEVYEGRPTQCRTWPFWPENMNSKAWKRDVVRFCPGAQVKQSPASLVRADSIRRQLDEQTGAEKELFE